MCMLGTGTRMEKTLPLGNTHLLAYTEKYNMLTNYFSACQYILVAMRIYNKVQLITEMN